MAISGKIDIIGSWLMRGVFTSKNDRAERRAWIEGLDNNNQMQGQATDYFLLLAASTNPSGTGAEGGFHHIITDLPLQAITVRRTGKNSVMAIGHYYRKFSSLIGPSNTLLMRSRGTVYVNRWYRLPYDIVSTPQGLGTEPNFTNGRPSGEINFPQGGEPTKQHPPPVPYSWEQPGAKFIVPFDLPYSPVPITAGLQGKANAFAVTFGDVVIQPNHIRFDDWSMDTIVQNGTQIRWQGSYQFTVIRGGFWQQTAFFDEAGENPQWKTVDGLRYELAEFAGVFEQ